MFWQHRRLFGTMPNLRLFRITSEYAVMRSQPANTAVISLDNVPNRVPKGEQFPACRSSMKGIVEFSPMRRMLAIVGSAVFLVIAPGVVAGYIPWRICQWQVKEPLAEITSFRILGVVLIVAGFPVLLDSFARFALQGLGTPAPIFPTRHLVVSGLYRHVRNPMYVAVVALILGQGLFFGNLRVLEYGIAVWMAFHLFVLIYEEPILRNTYGSEYQVFCANVRRWVPRLRPWRQGRGDG